MSHHHHDHNHGQANEAYFDTEGAKLFATEDAKRVARQASDAFLGAVQFDTEKTAVLDFASGPGNISRILAPHCKSIVGVDISGKMIELYNEMAKEEGLSDKISGVKADITSDASALGGKLFDLIVCSLSYHHFSSPGEMTRALSQFLHPGGHLIIVDFLEAPKRHGEVDPTVKSIIAHGAFSEEDVREFYKAGGLELKKYEFAFDMVFKGIESKCFCSVGQKSA